MLEGDVIRKEDLLALMNYGRVYFVVELVADGIVYKADGFVFSAGSQRIYRDETLSTENYRTRVT